MTASLRRRAEGQSARAAGARGQANTEVLVITGLVVAVIIGMMVTFRGSLIRATASLGEKVRCAVSSGEGCGSGGAGPSAARNASPAGPYGLAPAPGPAGGQTASGTPGLPGGGTASGTPGLPGGGTASGTPGLPGGGTASGTPGLRSRPKVLPGIPDFTTGLGPGVDDIINSTTFFKSSTFALAHKKYTITWGETGKGSYCNRTKKIIVIDSKWKGNDAVIADIYAHEMGHAFNNFDEGTIPDMSDPKFADWITAQVQKSLDDEGEAILREFQIREAQIKEGQPPIPISGVKAAEYEKIWAQYQKDHDKAKAVRAIGEIVGKYEHPSTAPDQTYWDYYFYAWSDASIRKSGIDLSGVRR